MKAIYLTLSTSLLLGAMNLAHATPIAKLDAPAIAPAMQAGDVVSYDYTLTNYTPRVLGVSEVISGNSTNEVTITSTTCNPGIPAKGTCKFTVTISPVLATIDGDIADIVTVNVDGRGLVFTSTINAAVTTPTYVADSLAVIPTSNTMLGGSKQRYKATADYSNANGASGTFDVTTLATWSSTDTAVATVGASTGIVSAANTGSTTINATLATAGTDDAALAVTHFGYVISSDQEGNGAATSAIYLCALDSTGTNVTSACSPSGPNPYYPSIGAPWAVAIDTQGKYLYTSLYNSTQVSYCAIDATDGSLSDCKLTGGGSGSTTSYSIAINPAGNFAYIGNSNGTVSICAAAANGVLSGCQASATSLPSAGVSAISFNADGTRAYFGSFSTSSANVAMCNASSVTGKISGCKTIASVGGGFQIWSMALDPNGQYIYFGLNSGVDADEAWSCTVDSSGLLSGCGSMMATVTSIPSFASGMTVNSTGTQMTLSSYYPGETTSCALSGGVFSSCSVPTNPNGMAYPVGIVYR